MNRFGQCCLLARRLIEAGVRFVTVNTFLTVFDEITWDIHGSKPFTSIEGMRDIVCPMYDQAYSALIEDLDRARHARQHAGLQPGRVRPHAARQSGRRPRPLAAVLDGYFAGGGVQGGRVVGRSDAIGGYPAERPVAPAEIAATIFHSLGLNLETKLPGPAGRPFPLVDSGTKPINELF